MCILVFFGFPNSFSLVLGKIKSCWFCQTQLYWVSKSKSRSVTFLSPCHPNYTATYSVWCPTWYWWTGFNIDRYLYQVSAGQASIWACIFYRNLQLRFFCLAHACPIASRSDNTFYFLLTINAIKKGLLTFHFLHIDMIYEDQESILSPWLYITTCSDYV